MAFTSSLRFLYIFDQSGLLCATPNAIIDYLYIRQKEAGKKTLVFLVKRLLVGIPTAAIADNKSEQIAKMQPHVTT